MQIKQGWSGEVGPNRWAKFDIVLEEVDLLRLTGGRPVDVNTSVAYYILEAEAERLIYDKLIRRHGYDQNEGVTKMRALAERVQMLISQAFGEDKQ